MRPPRPARSSLSGPSGVAAAVRRFWLRSYAPDYLGCVLLAAALVYLHLFVEPFHRMFSLDDHAKQYPHALIQRVSAWENIVYAGLAPLALLLLWAGLARPGWHAAHVTILGLLISLSLTTLLTDVVKNAVGRPRPDLIARCKPELGTPDHALVTVAVCTERDPHTLHDGWRSFPSGHSSFAFAGLGYLALFLAGQLHIFRPHADLARILVVLAPLLLAALIAMSRLADYRHDVFDVTVGSLLGMSVAYLSYRRYYRPLYHPKCDSPFPSRAAHAAHAAGTPTGKVGDVERQAQDFSLTDASVDDETEAYLLTDTHPSAARSADTDPP